VLITVVEIVEPLPLIRLDFKFAMSLLQLQRLATQPRIVEIRNSVPKVFALEPEPAPAMLIASIPTISMQPFYVLGPSLVIWRQVVVAENAAVQTVPLANPKSNVWLQRAPR